jgi:16S rRNA (cytosine1402-N4)-methyltransferase
MNTYHTSVLLQEVIEFLNIGEGKKYIDATLGGGGHTSEILKSGGKVLGIDADQDAIDYVTEKINNENAKYKIGTDMILVKGNFKDVEEIAKKNNFDKVAGILFDLGVSSHQFDIAERGFSFQKEGPLDMRMDRDLKIQAKDLVNILTKGELYELFNKLGEERFARTIASSIISARRIGLIQTTTQLSEIIRRAVPNNNTRLDTTARIFQSLRIVINDELNNLRNALPQAYNLLAKNGRLAVISFHSLEDRIVKKHFIQLAEQGKGIILTKKPVKPNEEEIEKNKRSRSAKLRVFEKI